MLPGASDFVSRILILQQSLIVKLTSCFLPVLSEYLTKYKEINVYLLSTVTIVRSSF